MLQDEHDEENCKFKPERYLEAVKKSRYLEEPGARWFMVPLLGPYFEDILQIRPTGIVPINYRLEAVKYEDGWRNRPWACAIQETIPIIPYAPNSVRDPFWYMRNVCVEWLPVFEQGTPEGSDQWLWAVLVRVSSPPLYPSAMAEAEVRAQCPELPEDFIMKTAEWYQDDTAPCALAEPLRPTGLQLFGSGPYGDGEVRLDRTQKCLCWPPKCWWKPPREMAPAEARP